MDKKNMYAVLSPKEGLVTNMELNFFEDKKSLHSFLEKLSGELTTLNQTYLSFSRVFPKGSVYPTDVEGFKRANKERKDRIINLMGDYFVSRRLKDGELIEKGYMFEEDFLFHISEWKKNGVTDITILNEKHSHCAEYYYNRDVLNRWNSKDRLIA